METPMYAEPINAGSWLNRPEHDWFRCGYNYATTQTKAIPALAMCSPEDLYFALTLIVRGAKKAGLKEMTEAVLLK